MDHCRPISRRLKGILSIALLSFPSVIASPSIDYRYFVAGGTCAAISHGITTPIDVVKTKMQSDPCKYKSLLPATAMIIREEGPQALVKGLGPTLVGYGVEGALKFGVYEVTKPLVVAAFSTMAAKMKLKSGSAGALPFLLASIAAGAIASVVLVPMESARIRMVTDPNFDGLSLLGGLHQLVKEAGLIPTLTVGMGAMLAKQVPYTFGKQVTFDVVAKFVYGVLDEKPSVADAISKVLQPKWVVSAIAAMIASVMACLLSQPGDVILTETYKGADEKSSNSKNQPSPKNRGLSEVSASIFERHSDEGLIQGLSGFYTGLYARLVHVGMIITSQLIIYDLVKQLLGLPATGSH
eukprot:scaffold249312_cov72-Cyclotella_meneghiniana.AAC.10